MFQDCHRAVDRAKKPSIHRTPDMNSTFFTTGSACNSALAEPSYVLRALGRSERLSESSLRFGLGRTTTECDIDTAIAVLSREVGRLREIAGAQPPKLPAAVPGA